MATFASAEYKNQPCGPLEAGQWWIGANSRLPTPEVYVHDSTHAPEPVRVFRSFQCDCTRIGSGRGYAREDSNLWPLAPEASALSAELRAHICLRQLYPNDGFGAEAGTEARCRHDGLAVSIPDQLPFVGYPGDTPWRHFLLIGGSMTFRDGVSGAGSVRLNEEDLTYLMNLLRNATQPVTTQQLIDVLRRQPGQFHINSESVPAPPGESPES